MQFEKKNNNKFELHSNLILEKKLLKLETLYFFNFFSKILGKNLKLKIMNKKFLQDLNFLIDNSIIFNNINSNNLYKYFSYFFF